MENSHQKLSNPIFFYGLHLLLFSTLVVTFFSIAPSWGLQGYDGQFNYNQMIQNLKWSHSILALNFNPLEGMGSTFYPWNYYFIPYIYIPLTLFSDPNWQIWGLYILAAISLFSSCLLLYIALKLKPSLVISAAWLTFFLTMIWRDLSIIAPITIQWQINTNLVIGCFALIRIKPLERGFHYRKHHTTKPILATIAFLISTIILVFSDVVSASIPIPIIILALFWLLFSSKTRLETTWKIASILIATIIQLILFTPQYAINLVRYTARYTFASELISQPQYHWGAGFLFHEETGLIVIFLIIGLTHHIFRPPIYQPWEPIKSIAIATGIYYLIIATSGILYIYTDLIWKAPFPHYYNWVIYPLTAIFIITGLEKFVQIPQTIFKLDQEWPSLGITLNLLIIFISFRLYYGFNFLEHLNNRIIILMTGLALGIWKKNIAIITMITIFLLHLILLQTSTPYNFEQHGTTKERLGLIPTPIIEYLTERIAITPGSKFQGYADDYYTKNPSPYNFVLLGMLENFKDHFRTYGNGHMKQALTIFNIPILSEYSAYITTPYYLLFSRLLNDPINQFQSIAYLITTKPDIRILSMMGLRYLITDQPQPDLKDINLAYQWKELYIYEIKQPNLANYSPTEILPINTISDIITTLQNPNFNPTLQVILSTPINQTLAPIYSSQLNLIKGGYKIKAISTGRSLLLLPIQYSHCFNYQLIQGDPSYQIVRANLIQTGIIFNQSIELQSNFNLHSLNQSCRIQDQTDLKQLKITDQVITKTLPEYTNAGIKQRWLIFGQKP